MKRYKDATALRRALETRLKQESENTGSDLGRLRRRVVFDRIAVRLSVDDGTQWILKGGAALEFRLGGRARATKDLDLAVTSVVSHY
jgi:predicted nucleotidyltransferase component of viral defense system